MCQGLERMVGMERNLERDEKRARRWGGGSSGGDKRGDWLPEVEFCTPSIDPEEAEVSSSLAGSGARRMGTATWQAGPQDPKEKQSGQRFFESSK